MITSRKDGMYATHAKLTVLIEPITAWLAASASSSVTITAISLETAWDTRTPGEIIPYSVPIIELLSSRYFYGLLFFTWLALVYTNFITLEFLFKTTLLNPIQVLVSFFAPIPAALVGYLHEDFFVLFVSTISLFALGYTCYLIFLHSESFVSGITLTELNREKGCLFKLWLIFQLYIFRVIQGAIPHWSLSKYARDFWFKLARCVD